MSVRILFAGLIATVLLTAPARALEAEIDDGWQIATTVSDDVKEDPRIGRYSTMDGSKAFVLDRTGDKARLRFSGSPEILILETVPGPQGVTYFKDEIGRTILRLMPRGGATLYDEAGNEGDPYGREKKAKPLVLKQRGVGHVRKRSKTVQENLNENQKLRLSLTFDPSLEVLKAKAEIAAGEIALAEALSDQSRMKSSEANRQDGETRSLASLAPPPQQSTVAGSSQKPGSGPQNSALNVKTATTVSDALEVLNVALRRLAKDDLAREVMSERITTVIFRAAEEKAILLEEDVLIVSYVPGKGLEGRLSSAAIELYLLENL